MATPPSSPPLLGDGRGSYRVLVVGNSGVGKSTIGMALARVLDVPYISMDKIMWQPGWVDTPPEQFQARLREAMNQDRVRGWVADGDYEHRSGPLAWDASTDVIWLDPPLALYLPRLLWRTFLRLLGLREPCSPGCPERISEAFFSKDSIIWWCISHHWTARQQYQKKMQEIGLGTGSDINGRKMRRLGGWGKDLKNWLEDVKDMVRAK